MHIRLPDSGRAAVLPRITCCEVHPDVPTSTTGAAGSSIGEMPSTSSLVLPIEATPPSFFQLWQVRSPQINTDFDIISARTCTSDNSFLSYEGSPADHPVYISDEEDEEYCVFVSPCCVSRRGEVRS